jgi:hypothetical protein
VATVEFSLPGPRPSRTDDADRVNRPFGENHQDEPASDRANGDKLLLNVGVDFIDHLEEVCTSFEQLARLGE